MHPISSIDEFNDLVNENTAVLAYFSSEACSVCKVLKPRVVEMADDHFPQIKTVYIQTDNLPELAAQWHIFTAPTVVVFFEGRETIRKSRAFGIEELKNEIQRPYSLLFE